MFAGPIVVVQPMTARIDHAIDRGRSADHAAAGMRDPAVVQIRLRLGQVIPVVLSAFQQRPDAQGMSMRQSRSEPPASNRRILFPEFSLNRDATTHPAEPAPMTT